MKSGNEIDWFDFGPVQKTPDGFTTIYTYPTIKWDAYIRRV